MAREREEGQAPDGSLPSLLSCPPPFAFPLQKLVITGGIASGKSTVVGFLAELGLSTISADQEAARLRSDPEKMRCLSLLLGESEPSTRESLRSGLNDQAKRRIINRFFHAEVWGAIASSSAPVAEVPLLVESCLWPFFRCVWTLSCPQEVRLARLAERNLDPGQAARLISLQVQDGTREAVADEVLDSSQPLDDLKSQVMAAFHRLPHGIAH